MTELCALIEGPRWADTKFYGNWLLAAAKANELWTEALNNPRFSKRVDRLTVANIPDFNISATVLLSRLEWCGRDLAPGTFEEVLRSPSREILHPPAVAVG